MKRCKQDAEKTKSQLIDAACEVFYREGVARATLEQIAREAGVTRGALYWHFNNKVDILDALFQDTMPSIEALQGELEGLQADAFWQGLEQHYVRVMQRLISEERFRKFSTVMHLKCEMTESNAQVVALINQYRHTWIQSTENIVALAVRVEALPKQTDIMLTTRLLCSLLVGIMVTFLGEFEETRDMNKVVSPAPFLTHILRLVQQSPILCD